MRPRCQVPHSRASAATNNQFLRLFCSLSQAPLSSVIRFIYRFRHALSIQFNFHQSCASSSRSRLNNALVVAFSYPFTEQINISHSYQLPPPSRAITHEAAMILTDEARRGGGGCDKSRRVMKATRFCALIDFINI